MSAEDTATKIGDELLRIHCESWGAGAESAKTYVLDDAVICFLDGLELLPNEEFLLDEGKGDLVVELRSKYQEAVGASFCAAVERAGEHVTLADAHIDGDAEVVLEIAADRRGLKDP